MRVGFSRFLSKFFFEILPATIASAVAGYLFSHLGILSTPATAPQAAAVSPASPDMLKTVRNEPEAIVGNLKKVPENSQQPSPNAPLAEARLKQEEQAAAQAIRQAKEAEAQAVRQAKEAEAKALAAAKKLAARSAPQAQPKVLAPAEAPLGQIVITRPAVPAPAQATVAPPAAPAPVTAAPAPAPAPVLAQPPIVVVPPAPQIAAPLPEPRPAAPRETASSSGGWFSGGAPPRPPATLPQQNLTNSSDGAGPGG